jgi:hypothetical protein
MSDLSKTVGERLDVILAELADLPLSEQCRIAYEIAESFFDHAYTGNLCELEFTYDCKLFSDRWTAAIAKLNKERRNSA